MKKLSVLVLLFSLGFSSLAQPPGPVKNRAYFLDKNKSQRTTAWVLTGVGAGMTVGGAIGFNQNFEVFGPGGETEAAIIFVGVGVLGAGVIMHIIATKSRQKADLALASVPVFYPGSNGVHALRIPSLRWKIPIVKK